MLLVKDGEFNFIVGGSKLFTLSRIILRMMRSSVL